MKPFAHRKEVRLLGLDEVRRRTGTEKKGGLVRGGEVPTLASCANALRILHKQGAGL
jgi:hypothetical protein